VIAQTFQDWEAIVVDDGSTDNTAEVVAQYADERIRYIHQANSGLSAARNTGIANAHGEFVALLDADDLWEPTFLDRMIATFRDEPSATVVYCGFRYVNAEGALLKQSVLRVVLPSRFYAEMLRNGNWLVPCAVVVRVNGYRDAGPFDEMASASSDFDMWLRMAKAGAVFIGVPEVLVRYRRTGNNMSDDIDRMSTAARVVLERHLGPLEPFDEQSNSTTQTAIEQLHVAQAIGYLAQGDAAQSANHVAWLLQYELGSACWYDLWYSLACAHQSVGQRGDLESWRPERADDDVSSVLGQLPNHNIPARAFREMAAHAHLGLAWLNYGQGNLARARRHLCLVSVNWPRRLASKRGRALFIRLLPLVYWLRRQAALLSMSE